MISGRILVDTTARRLNNTAPKPAFFRKALWEQAPDPSELPDPKLFEFFWSNTREKADSKDVGGNTIFDKAIVLTATETTQNAIVANNTAPRTTKGAMKLATVNNIPATRTTLARVQAFNPCPTASTPHIDVEFFIFAAVASGLGAWTRPAFVNKVCALIRYDVRSMLDRLLPKADDTILCLALYYITKVFDERPGESAEVTGWDDTVLPLRMIRLGLTLAYKWHEDYPHRYQCALCHLEICDCVEWNGGERKGAVRGYPKEKNNVITEIWKPTQFHPLLSRYAVARMERGALFKLNYIVSVNMGGYQWVRFLNRLRKVCNVDTGAQRLSEEKYRLAELAIFELGQNALHNRSLVNKAKAA